MRQLNALQTTLNDYDHHHHSTLFKNMNLANNGKGRDHWHLREGVKEEMPFMCLLKADLKSDSNYVKCVIGGRDDNQSRKTEMLFVEFEAWRDFSTGQIFIGINTRDRQTTYEESLRLANYCLVNMAITSSDLLNTSTGGNGANKKGYYPQTAQNGFFGTFTKTFDSANGEFVLPEEMRPFFKESSYNLIGYNIDAKKTLSPKPREIQL